MKVNKIYAVLGIICCLMVCSFAAVSFAETDATTSTGVETDAAPSTDTATETGAEEGTDATTDTGTEEGTDAAAEAGTDEA
ncbi:hypothetical protein ACAG65_12105, partial [Halodesulfovibrio aestuarii]|uniref:hypothetical protein n=1 Tax=Halodesulfovibrio aestuarii TaxID=126333 RepID=UPI003521CEF2